MRDSILFSGALHACVRVWNFLGIGELLLGGVRPVFFCEGLLYVGLGLGNDVSFGQLTCLCRS